MEAIPAQQEPTLTLRQQILRAPDFDTILVNARKFAKEGLPEKSIRDTIIEDPDFYILLRNARALAKNEKKPAGFGSRLARAAVITTGVLTATGGAVYAGRDKILETGRRIETPDVVYDPRIFAGGVAYAVDLPSPSPTPTETPTPPPTPSPTPEPTVDPKIQAQKEIGNRNVAEYFLGDLVKQFKQNREVRFKTDPEFARRIQKEFLNSDRINILYLGVDQIRGRYGDYNDEGLGRSDSIMVISFDPHTFKTTTISIPRDLYDPLVARFFPGIPKINSMTMINAILEGRNVDANKFVKEIIENATGIPIDWIIKTPVDFVFNANDGGVFNELFPDGLEINVPDDIVDVDAPIVDGKKSLLFNKGPQKMNGEKIMRYATERRADSDYGRADRQRQVLQASMTALLPSIMTNLMDGNTQTLDKIIFALERQKNSFNLFYDVDLITVAKTMRDKLTNLQKTAKGIVVLGVLAANTVDEIKNVRENRAGMFVSFGVSNQNLLESAGVEGISMSKPAGSNLQSAPLLYWDPVRKRVFELFQ